jgi:general secretion pathway protein G
MAQKNTREPASAVEIRFFLDMYYTDCGHYPSTHEGLDALMHKVDGHCPNWGPLPYADQLPKDPWGHFWSYTAGGDGQSFELKSLGSDNKEGGAGDGLDIVYRWPQ